MECEICGRRATKKAIIDGASVNVCDECVKYGKLVPDIPTPKPKFIQPKDIPESSKYIDPNYLQIIKKAREKMNLKIEELAKKINEKESVISKLETGRLSPTFELAKKLEDFLGIELIKEYSETKITAKKSSENLTIGDIIDIGELND